MGRPNLLEALGLENDIAKMKAEGGAEGEIMLKIFDRVGTTANHIVNSDQPSPVKEVAHLIEVLMGASLGILECMDDMADEIERLETEMANMRIAMEAISDGK